MLETLGNDGLAKGNRENGEIQSQFNPRGRACGNIFLTRIFNFHDRFAGVLAAENYSRTLAASSPLDIGFSLDFRR